MNEHEFSALPPVPIPSVPWQITGNHWLAVPCIHPADGAIYAIGMLHRASRSAIEFAGSSEFVFGTGPPLAYPTIIVGSEQVVLRDAAMAWERGLGWLPTFTCTVRDVVVRATIFAPFGRDSDTAGIVYAFAIENRSDSATTVTVALSGTLGHRQLRVRQARPFEDAHSVLARDDGTVILSGRALPGLAALAIRSDGEALVRVSEGAAAPSYSIERRLELPGNGAGRVETAFYIAAGPEADGAHATVQVMRRRTWRDLLKATRDALRGLEQTSGHEAIDRLLNHNLLMAYFYSVGRALDDAHYYVVRTRVPWHSCGLTVREWEALTWTLPAVQLADHGLARELLLRLCELHGYAPGMGVRYLDGTLFEPGFSLEGAAGYALATDRYIRDTGDEHVVDDAVIADTLYLVSEDVAARRHEQWPLYATDVTPSGAPAALPFTLHGNAVVSQALDVLRRTLDEETARGVQDPEAARAALRRQFVRDGTSQGVFAAATDLRGSYADGDDPSASALWLPMYDVVARDDSTYRRTARSIAGPPRSLAQQIARLLGPTGGEVLEWLRRAPLDHGRAAAIVDASGKAVADGGDAALGGLLASTLWYAIHAAGVKP
ncbi:MAG: hypothetical protein ACT4R6_09945 [Gemmatimonadaceae bacterium]